MQRKQLMLVLYYTTEEPQHRLPNIFELVLVLPKQHGAWPWELQCSVVSGIRLLTEGPLDPVDCRIASLWIELI